LFDVAILGKDYEHYKKNIPLFSSAVGGRRCGAGFDTKGSCMISDKFVVDLYIRVSTDRQVREGDSLEEQENELKKFCDYRNYHIHNIFIERGRSGGTTNRPEYQKLIRDIQSKKIQAVVVKKLDRLSRSLLDFEHLVTLLQDNDVEFISLRENFDTTTAMGKAMLRVALVFAQLEREQTSERVKDVFSFRAEQGLFNGGTCPYGYDVVSKELIPNKQEKKVVETMFDLFLKLKASSLVEQELNMLGFRNRKGLLWDRRHIHMILKRPLYKGYIQWNSEIHKGVHQPLVSESVFDQVQKIFDERQYKNSRNKMNGLLKGLLVCGECGNSLSPNYTKKKNGKIYHYYRCNSTVNRKKKGKACTVYIASKVLDDLVIASVLDYSSESKLAQVQRDIDSTNQLTEAAILSLKTEQTQLEWQLKSCRQKKDQYLDSLVTGDFSKEERGKINARIDEFSLEEKQTQARLYQVEFQLTETSEKILSIDSFKEQIVSFKFNHASLSETDLKDWLNEHISRIIYKENAVDIRFRLLEDSS